jgi:hypothetical protein
LRIVDRGITHRPPRRQHAGISLRPRSHLQEHAMNPNASFPALPLRLPSRRLGGLALAAALTASLQPATAADIVDFPSALQYEARIGEVNNVEIKPRTLAGNTVLDVRDFAGLRGCAPQPGSVISIRCDNADQLRFFSMEMDNQDDILIVNESELTLSGYQLYVRGGLGSDDLTGGSEDDEFYGDAGNDLLVGEGGTDILYGETGDDRLLGGDGVDKLDGGSGNDILFGEAGRDVLDGGSFDDHLNGGSGTDTLRGGSGSDFINAVDGERDTIDCGLGRDTVRADQFDVVDRNCEDVSRIVI